jgi:hypothetical protein
MSIVNRSTPVEPLRPVLHLVRGTATQAAWHTEHPQRPNPETQNQSFDGLGEAGPQRKRDQKPVEVWALARTPDQDETGLSQAEMIYLLPTYQSRLT